MAESSEADAIRQVERDRLRSLVEGDVERALALHADDYELISPGGATWSKESYLGALASGEVRYHRFEPEGEISVRLHPTAAVVRYIAVVDIDYPGGHDADRLWHTDFYELRDGRWQAVWSQATRVR